MTNEYRIEFKGVIIINAKSPEDAEERFFNTALTQDDCIKLETVSMENLGD